MLGLPHPCGDFGAKPSGRRMRAREAAIRMRPKKSISTNASLHAVFHDLSSATSENAEKKKYVPVLGMTVYTFIPTSLMLSPHESDDDRSQK
jgi:hypothetical protein